MEQEIRFCKTNDNLSIAYAAVGSGSPFVKVANWLNHLELDWISPVWSHWLDEFLRDQRVIRYDERGTGLSDRNVEDFTLNAFVDDLESVIDAVGVDRFPLLSISQGGPVAIAYAVRFPEKVSHLILYGSFATGWKKGNLAQEDLEKRQAQLALIRQGWDSRNPATRQLFTTMCIPDGNTEELRSFNELQKQSVSGINAARIFEAIGDLDVANLLSDIKVPVIVLHSRYDSLVPFDEGRKLASMIPNAKFVPLESANHLLLRHEPAWAKFVTEVNSFLGRSGPQHPPIGNFKRHLCRKCNREYEADMFYCLDDGDRLVELFPKEDDDGQVTRLL
ncbi:MAG: alpha/beta hydrolase [Pyrinomonadaceae bacterium]